MKWIVIRLPLMFQQGILYVHKDFVGKRTWIEWFKNYPVRASFGYKSGQKLDWVYLKFFRYEYNKRWIV